MFGVKRISLLIIFVAVIFLIFSSFNARPARGTISATSTETTQSVEPQSSMTTVTVSMIKKNISRKSPEQASKWLASKGLKASFESKTKVYGHRFRIGKNIRKNYVLFDSGKHKRYNRVLTKSPSGGYFKRGAKIKLHPYLYVNPNGKSSPGKRNFSKTEMKHVVASAAYTYHETKRVTSLQNKALDIVYIMPGKRAHESSGGARTGSPSGCYGVFQFDTGWSITKTIKKLSKQYKHGHSSSDWRGCAECSTYRFVKSFHDGGTGQPWVATLGR